MIPCFTLHFLAQQDGWEAYLCVVVGRWMAYSMHHRRVQVHSVERTTCRGCGLGCVFKSDVISVSVYT
jgi:hypothetical protein